MYGMDKAILQILIPLYLLMLRTLYKNTLLSTILG